MKMVVLILAALLLVGCATSPRIYWSESPTQAEELHWFQVGFDYDGYVYCRPVPPPDDCAVVMPPVELRTNDAVRDFHGNVLPPETTDGD